MGDIVEKDEVVRFPIRSQEDDLAPRLQDSIAILGEVDWFAQVLNEGLAEDHVKGCVGHWHRFVRADYP